VYEAITLKRGITRDTEFEKWTNKVWKLGAGAGSAGQLALRYKVYRCWVSEYQALPDLDAAANAVAIEHIKIENEGWERDHDVPEPMEPGS